MSEPGSDVARRVRIDVRHPESAFVAGRLRAAGWEVTEDDDWDLLWSLGEPDLDLLVGRSPQRRVNHLPGIGCLGVKSLLWRTVEIHRDLLNGRGIETAEFLPETFDMPRDWARFHRRAEDEPDAVWIKKPKNSARGEGVALLGDSALAEPGANWLVQRYIDRPHLVDGYKYTLRLYVAVTDTDPLTAFVFDDGLAKFTSRPFSDAPSDDRLAHLTNPDIQATNPELTGGPRKLTLLRYADLLVDLGIDPEPLFSAIHEMLAFVVVAGRERLRHDPRDKGLHPSGTFELLGFDVLVDADLRPWLLEANVGPSLAVTDAPDAANIEELAVKIRLIDSLIHVTGLGLGACDSPPPTHASGFRVLLPDPEVIRYMTLPRRSEQLDAPSLAAPESARAWALGEGLVVQVLHDGDLHVLNASAAFIWSAWNEGLRHEQIVEELSAVVPGDAGHLDDDVWDSTITMVEQGLLVVGGIASQRRSQDDRSQPADRSQPEGSTRSAYRWAGVTVGVGMPSAEVASWMDLALPGMADPTPTEVTAWVTVESRPDGWTVRYPEALVHCRSIRQLGPAVRAAVMELGGRYATVVCFRATLLCLGETAIIVTGSNQRRAGLIEMWEGPAFARLGDDLVTFSVGGEAEGHSVGIEQERPSEQLGELPGPGDSDPLSITPFGRFVSYRMFAKSPGGPVRPALLVHLLDGPVTGSPEVVPSTPLDAITDLLAARPRSAHGVATDTAAALVDLASGASAFRVTAGDPAEVRGALERLVAGRDELFPSPI